MKVGKLDGRAKVIGFEQPGDSYQIKRSQQRTQFEWECRTGKFWTIKEGGGIVDNF